MEVALEDVPVQSLVPEALQVSHPPSRPETPRLSYSSRLGSPLFLAKPRLSSPRASPRQDWSPAEGEVLADAFIAEMAAFDDEKAALIASADANGEVRRFVGLLLAFRGLSQDLQWPYTDHPRPSTDLPWPSTDLPWPSIRCSASSASSTWRPRRSPSSSSHTRRRSKRGRRFKPPRLPPSRPLALPPSRHLATSPTRFSPRRKLLLSSRTLESHSPQPLCRHAVRRQHLRVQHRTLRAAAAGGAGAGRRRRRHRGRHLRRLPQSCKVVLSDARWLVRGERRAGPRLWYVCRLLGTSLRAAELRDTTTGHATRQRPPAASDFNAARRGQHPRVRPSRTRNAYIPIVSGANGVSACCAIGDGRGPSAIQSH